MAIKRYFCDMRKRHITPTFLVAAIALAISGCTTPSSTPSSSPSSVSASTAPTATTSPVDQVRQQAITAYVGMWQSMEDAATTSDWQSPKLAQYAVEPALGVITRSLYTDHINGVITKGKTTYTPSVSSMDPADNPTTIIVVDCADTSKTMKVKANGEPYNDTPGGQRHVTAEVAKQQDGSWKVSQFAVEAVGSCG